MEIKIIQNRLKPYLLKIPLVSNFVICDYSFFSKLLFRIYRNSTQRDGRMVNIPASFAGGPGLKPLSREWLP